MKPKVFNSENLSEILETKDHLSVDDMAEDFEFVLKSDIEKLRNELIRLEYLRINFTKDYICKVIYVKNDYIMEMIMTLI